MTTSFDISSSPLSLRHFLPFYDPDDVDFSKDPDTVAMVNEVGLLVFITYY